MMPQLLRFVAILTMISCLWGCKDEETYPGMRTQEQRQLFQAINDSMLHLRPQALVMIRQQMQEANDSLTWYDYYLMFGHHYLLTDKPDSCLPYADRTLRFVKGLSEQTPRTRGLAAYALNCKAAYHYLLHHPADTTLALYSESYRLLMQSDAKEFLPDVSANIGDVYVAEGNLPEGSRWYRRALFLNDSLKLPAKQTLTLYMGLGRIYTTVGDFDQAASYYEMTDKRFDEMKPNMQSYFLNNYGNYFYYSKKYDEALSMFRRLKAHLEHYNAESNFDMYLCKINLADVFLNLGQTDSARYYVEQAEPFFKKHKVDVGIYYAQTIRLGIAMKERKYAEAEKVLKEAEGLTVSDLGMNAIRNKYLSDYYAAVGDYRKAYAGMSKQYSAKDLADYERVHMRSSEIMMRLTEDTLRLHQQLKLDQQQIRYERIRSALWIMLLVLIAVVLGIVLWFNHERKRKLKSHLEIMSLRLDNARQRISPHFVFNVLNSRINKTDQKEADLLMMLAQLIRSNLDITRQGVITLADELDFVNQYVKIESLLMGQEFEYHVEAPEREVLKQIPVPSMLVQILVENAIKHGLKNIEGPKKLCIKVTTNDEQTVIQVCDNGPGFDIRQYNSERSRTGLSIIRNTINAINEENKKAKMRFDIQNDNGCHSTLTIPKNIKLI